MNKEYYGVYLIVGLLIIFLYYTVIRHIETNYKTKLSRFNIIWHIKRVVFKYHTKRLVNKYRQLNINYKFKQSNMNLAKLRLLKARIMYWQSCFEAWGKYNIGGNENFGFSHDLNIKMSNEMMWMGFTRNFREWEIDMMKQKQFPNTINYYPEKTKLIKKSKNQSIYYPINYEE